MLFTNGANIKTDKTKFYVIVNLNPQYVNEEIQVLWVTEIENGTRETAFRIAGTESPTTVDSQRVR